MSGGESPLPVNGLVAPLRARPVVAARGGSATSARRKNDEK